MSEVWQNLYPVNTSPNQTILLLIDPLVDVIYVSPVELNDEMLQYYGKLMRMCEESGEDGLQQEEAQNRQSIEERFHFVVPERLHSFEVSDIVLAVVRDECLTVCCSVFFLGSQYVIGYVVDV